MEAEDGEAMAAAGAAEDFAGNRSPHDTEAANCGRKSHNDRISNQVARLASSPFFDSRACSILPCICLLLWLAATAGVASGEVAPDRPDECAKITDNTLRLACHDERTGRGPAGNDAESYLSRLWDLNLTLISVDRVEVSSK